LGHILITGEDLTIKKLIDFVLFNNKIKVEERVFGKIKKSREKLEEKIKKGEKIYGVNTEVGALSSLNREIDSKAEINLIKKHAIATGEFASKELARATLLVLINQLASGFSTISFETFNRLVDLANKDIYPLIHKSGSLGASGDLIPLADLALVIAGEGYIKLGNEIVKAKELLGEHELKAGDAISLINSTAYSTASLALSIYNFESILDLSCFITSLVMEALKCNSSPFKIETLSVKKHVDQMIVGNYILKILEGSKLIDSDKSIIQDPYSIRCIPQIFAAVKSNIDYCEYIVMREMNSYSGNPVIFGDKVYYGGNFHAQLLANAADLLKISASNLAYLSERQINRLLNPNLNRGLPPFLAKEGIGLMICQYLIAYYLNEIRTLATPSSIISVSTSADQEDFVSMSGNAVNDLEKCLDNLKMISSIETLCAYEGAKIRGYELLGKGTKLFYDLIKEKVEEYENINEKIEAIYRNYNFFVEELRKEFGSLFTE